MQQQSQGREAEVWVGCAVYAHYPSLCCTHSSAKPSSPPARLSQKKPTVLSYAGNREKEKVLYTKSASETRVHRGAEEEKP